MRDLDTGYTSLKGFLKIFKFKLGFFLYPYDLLQEKEYRQEECLKIYILLFFLILYFRILEMSRLIFVLMEEALACVGAQLLEAPESLVQLCSLSTGKQSQWHWGVPWWPVPH